MIDTHCHLTDPRLAGQLPQVLQRARQAGVSLMVSIGTDVADSAAALELCSANRDVLRCAVGVHPNETPQAEAAGGLSESQNRLNDMLANPLVVAVGEIGLDYSYGADAAQKAVQGKWLRMQMQLARQHRKPVVIHSRQAVEDCLGILEQFAEVPGVFHCFTGTAAEATNILQRGYYLSFTGVVTFKNGDALREIARDTPLDRLLLETDAPYLSPEPLRRQKINEPSLLPHTAAVVADLHGIDVAELSAVTDANARRLLHIG